MSPPAQGGRWRLAALGAAAGLLLKDAIRGRSGLCALNQPPLSSIIARTPSVAPDRALKPSVDMLPILMERPALNYLHHYDEHFKRHVPDFQLQYRTAEEQFLTEGEFAVHVMEVTNKGVIVQDGVTGIFGFMPRSDFGSREPPPVGALVNPVRCTDMDNTVIESTSPEFLRDQTGIVFEWDEEAGEGYIMPTRGQESMKMIRVLRRDISWHDSRRLFPGQFVQFSTAYHDEVPNTPNDEETASFALRVHCPEVRFTPWDRKGQYAAPAKSFRPQPRHSGKHPILKRFALAQPEVAEAESPMWLWEQTIQPKKSNRYLERNPIIPMAFMKRRIPKKRTRIYPHEEAIKRGHANREAEYKQNFLARKGMTPYRRSEVQSRAILYGRRLARDRKRKQRAFKMKAAELTRNPNPVVKPRPVQEF